MTDIRNVIDIDLIVANSIGAKYGTDLYKMQQITSSTAGQVSDRPPLPFTGVIENWYEDEWAEDKHIIVMQDQPYPCVINGIMVEMEAGTR